MFDGVLRPKLDPALNATARVAAGAGLSANTVTTLGLLTGIAAAVAIVFHMYWLGLVLVLLSRICDGLDGAVARINGKSDFGGYLDIVFDFAFYGMIPLAFILADPAANAAAGGVLLLTFYVNGASFLTYALMAEKRGIGEKERGSKSLLYTTGLTEATETITAFCLMCLFPNWFSVIAYVFAAMVVFTTINRFRQAYESFG